MKRNKKRTPFKDFMFMQSAGFVTFPTQKELDELPRPDVLCGVTTPTTLNDLTMGQLAELLTAGTEDIFKVIKSIIGVDAESVLKEPYERVIGFLNFVTREAQRIGDLFKSIKTAYTTEQIAAGVDDLNFGIFGTIDWYARRMGIHDHDEVMKVCWVRIWQCAKNDADTAAYDKRLNEIITKKR